VKLAEAFTHQAMTRIDKNVSDLKKGGEKRLFGNSVKFERFKICLVPFAGVA